MKTKFLLPHPFKAIGLVLFIPSLILGAAILFYEFHYTWLTGKVFVLYDGGSSILHSSESLTWVTDNLTNEIAGIGCIIGGIMLAFAREKEEDEYISKIRMESLMWATYFNYAVLLLSFFFVFSTGFLNVMMINMFSTLIVFIIRFNYLLYGLRKSSHDEK